jgi:hypothetical protein
VQRPTGFQQPAKPHPGSRRNSPRHARERAWIRLTSSQPAIGFIVVSQRPIPSTAFQRQLQEHALRHDRRRENLRNSTPRGFSIPMPSSWEMVCAPSSRFSSFNGHLGVLQSRSLERSEPKPARSLRTSFLTRFGRIFLSVFAGSQVSAVRYQ